ncbi:MAG TPA: uroporphyrinogen decarboxylase family protein [Candidatus Limnocylindrales bacterium]|nr:uroporphyrinogen decarboxylase family protein [Candidatus Limnocylindrales bacterium]
MPMTARDRVLATLAHEVPDRVPIVLGPSNATGIKMGTYRRIKALAGIDGGPESYLYEWPELGTAKLDEETYRRLHADVRGVLDHFPAQVRERNATREPLSPMIDDWGGGHIYQGPEEWFPGIHPLADASTLEEIEAHPWPDMTDPSRFEGVRAEAQRLRDDGQYAAIGCPWLAFPLERAMAMQGAEAFLANLAAEPAFAEALLWKTQSLCKTLMDGFLRECGDLIDMVKIGDDLGSQVGLLMSPAMYRRTLKPIHADLIAFIRERTKAPIVFHTDGDVYDLLGDFIEIGVDVLNPVQASAGGMSDFAGLKKRFGDNLVFCGGMDTHHVLPNGTPDEVRAEVRRVIGTLGAGGGYMLGAVHTVMNDVPAENILAMVDAVEAFGRYPLRE